MSGTTHSAAWARRVALALAALGLAALLVVLKPTAIAGSTSAKQARLGQTAVTSEREARAAYARLPLSFVPNAGQQNEQVRYSAQGAGFGFFFTKREALLSFSKGRKAAALSLGFLGASPSVNVEAARSLPGRVNYLIARDRARWQTNLPTYGELRYRGLWPGIDLVFRGAKGQLKYEFHVKAGARVSDIRLAYRGVKGLSLGRSGALRIQTSLGVLSDTAPRSYQPAGGGRVPLASRYVLQGRRGYGFALGRGYDPRRRLVIDPGLVYSTYLGGSSQDDGNGIAVDPSGNAYVTGVTLSPDFPTQGAVQPSSAGSFDAFVTKLNASGSALVYSTYLGGSSDDFGNGIAVNGTGSAYVTGLTFSTDFPTTASAFQTSSVGFAAFVTKLNASGSALLYSTYLGGSSSDAGNGIAVNGTGTAYVTGFTNSLDFPTMGAYQPTYGGGFNDAFVTKLNTNASGAASLVYSTYLGGGSEDVGNGIGVNGTGTAYVTGSTDSVDFPTMGAYQPANAGFFDAFVTKLNTNASGAASLVYSTYLGGSSSDFGSGVAVNGLGTAYVTGSTFSPDFPTMGAFQPAPRPAAVFGDAFVTKLNTNASGPASLVYSTYLGGTGNDQGSGIAVDSSGNAYVTGSAPSLDFPTTPGAFQTVNAGIGDAFVTKLNTNASGAASLVYSTYLGGSLQDDGNGIAVDSSGNAYVTGTTNSLNFPTTPGSFQTEPAGGNDAFVTKLDPTPAGQACPDDDEDDDGLTDEREFLLFTLLGDPDSDDDGVKDGNEDSDDDGEDDEDEDDDEDECPNDSDGDGEDDEDDEDDDEDDD